MENNSIKLQRTKKNDNDIINKANWYTVQMLSINYNTYKINECCIKFLL
jgi:hypothetical protein